MSEDDATRWADIASAYALGKLSVRQICAEYKISAATLYRRASREGWARRAQAKASRGQAKASRGQAKASRGRDGRTSKPQAHGGKNRLIARLYSALERKMSEFEEKQNEGAVSAAESERNARTLNTMVRLFERLQAMEDKASAQAGSARRGKDAHPASAQLSASDADRLRSELAQRLARLRAGRGDR